MLLELAVQYANVAINQREELLGFLYFYFVTLYGTMVTHDLLEREHKINLGLRLTENLIVISAKPGEKGRRPQDGLAFDEDTIKKARK